MTVAGNPRLEPLRLPPYDPDGSTGVTNGAGGLQRSSAPLLPPEIAARGAIRGTESSKAQGIFPIVTRTSTELPSASSASVRHVTVDAEREGQRIDNFLAGQLKGVPKSLIYRIVRPGQVNT